MSESMNIHLSHNDADAFLHSLMHPMPDVQEARRTFMRDAENNTSYEDINGETSISSEYIDTDGIEQALRFRKE